MTKQRQRILCIQVLVGRVNAIEVEYSPGNHRLPHPIEIEVCGIVPCDFRIRRILLPATISAIPFPSVATRTSDNLDLGNTVAVPENNTDLGGGGTLFGELADLVDDLIGGGLEPGRRAAGEGDGGGGNALALAVKTTVAVSMGL